MLFPSDDFVPASLCSYESTDNSFGGSVEAVAGGGSAVDIGGFDAAGSAQAGNSSSNPFDTPGAGLSATTADAASFGALAAGVTAGVTGVTGFPGGALAALALSLATYGSPMGTAASHFGQDIAVSLGNTIAVSPAEFAGQQ
jgi:hypothetical protein